jgi:hypothetical protein
MCFRDKWGMGKIMMNGENYSSFPLIFGINYMVLTLIQEFC